MREFNWQQIAVQAAKGDKDAFEMLYKQTERSVYFTCLKLLGNKHDAKDVMQDTYVTAFDKLSDLGDYSNIPAWINRIAVNNCKMLFRKRHIDYLEDIPEQAAEIVDENEIIPSDYVSSAEKRRIIMNIIDTQLSDIQRQTIILYYYDEMSVADIAEIMECPEGTVKYRLSAARKKIGEAVLIYEKENDDKLHAIAPIPVLTRILRKEAEEIAVPKIQIFRTEASASQQSSGKNIGDKINKGGTNTMTKALQGKIIAGAAAVVVVGGGITAAVALNRNNEPNISGPDLNSSSVVSVAETDGSSGSEEAVEDSSSEAAAEEQDSSAAEAPVPQKEPVIAKYGGFAITFPDDFRPNYHINNSERKFHVKYVDTEDAIHMQYQAFTLWGNDQEYRPEEVRDVIFNDLYFWNTTKFREDDIHDYYSTYIPDDAEFSVDEEEYLELDGCPFLKQSGILTLEKGYGGSYDVSYVAYYGVIPTQQSGEVPFVLFFHTRSTKPEIIAEMKEVAKTAAENGVYVGDDIY